MIDFFIIGEITNVHGIHGAVKVIPCTDDIARFRKLKKVRLVHHGSIKEYAVENVQLQNRFVILKLSGINDRDTASFLRGAVLEVSRGEAIKLPSDTYFIGDLIGCRVTETDGNILGVVDDVLSTGSNDVYSVTDGQGRNIMIPAIAQVVKSVDIEKGEIVVELLPGLREIYI